MVERLVFIVWPVRYTESNEYTVESCKRYDELKVKMQIRGCRITNPIETKRSFLLSKLKGSDAAYICKNYASNEVSLFYYNEAVKQKLFLIYE